MQDGTTKGNGAVPEGPAAADPVRVFREGVYPYANRMKRAKYERLKAGLQIELLKVQHCLLHLWRRARKEAGLDDVRLHDLRHSCAMISNISLLLLLLVWLLRANLLSAP